MYMCTIILVQVGRHTVKPPNKGHIGDNINSAVLFFIERLSSPRGSKYTKTIGYVIFGTSNSALCREVYYTVSLFRRVHYRRFHCTCIVLPNIVADLAHPRKHTDVTRYVLTYYKTSF